MRFRQHWATAIARSVVSARSARKRLPCLWSTLWCNGCRMAWFELCLSSISLRVCWGTAAKWTSRSINSFRAPLSPWTKAGTWVSAAFKTCSHWMSPLTKWTLTKCRWLFHRTWMPSRDRLLFYTSNWSSKTCRLLLGPRWSKLSYLWWKRTQRSSFQDWSRISSTSHSLLTPQHHSRLLSNH